MKPIRVLFVASGWFFITSMVTAPGQSSNAVTATPVYVPDYAHANALLPNGLIAWDALQKSAVATNGQDIARFVFSFTNVSPGTIAILNGHGSCSCTTVELPTTPWLVPAGGTGQIGATINLSGKLGILFN
jgi:hypothetical protein